MSAENKNDFAKSIFDTLCNAIERMGWNYKKDEKEPVVYFGVSDDDLQMQFAIIIDEKRQLIRLLSPMPYKMSEEKRMEGVVATCMASYKMVDGNFDYDLSDGSIVFRMTVSFRESIIGEGLFQYMIACSCAMVEEYGKQFLAIDKGTVSISEFLSNNN